MESLFLSDKKIIELKFVSPREKITLESMKNWENLKKDNITDSEYYNEIREILKKLPKLEYEVKIFSY